MSSIEIRGLTRTFPGRPPVHALRGIDLDVADGSIVAVLGPSGCGKTTLLRTVAGLDRPDAGTVRLGDRAVDGPGVHLPPHQRAVGLVPQEGALFPHLDVGANIAFGLRGRPRPERRSRVEDLLDLVGLPGAAKRRPHQLSGGQQQRVALARALAPEPAVVLLDEPFSALDTGLRTALRAEIGGLLRRTGTTAVLVTHDQVEAMTMADTIAVLREGEIVQIGRPDEVYRRPADAWIGTFVGDAVRLPGRRHGDAQADGPLGRVDLADDADHHPGPDVSLFVRPEQIRPAVGTGTDTDTDTGAEATVVAVRFQGPDVLVDLTLDAAEAPTGDPTEVTARWPSTTSVEVGWRVRVAVEGPVLAHRPGDPAAPSADDDPTTR